MSGPIKIRLHDPEQETLVPARAYPGDAGFDLTVSADTFVRANSVADIPCGFDIELPIGWWGLIVPRSSTWRRHGVLVQQAVIDQGYRGPMFIVCFNPSTVRGWYAKPGTQYIDEGVWHESKGRHVYGVQPEPGVMLRAGERVAQLVPLPLYPGLVKVVPQLSGSLRGTNGFGSSG